MRVIRYFRFFSSGLRREWKRAAQQHPVGLSAIHHAVTYRRPVGNNKTLSIIRQKKTNLPAIRGRLWAERYRLLPRLCPWDKICKIKIFFGISASESRVQERNNEMIARFYRQLILGSEIIRVLELGVLFQSLKVFFNLNHVGHTSLGNMGDFFQTNHLYTIIEPYSTIL